MTVARRVLVPGLVAAAVAAGGCAERGGALADSGVIGASVSGQPVPGGGEVRLDGAARGPASPGDGLPDGGGISARSDGGDEDVPAAPPPRVKLSIRSTPSRAEVHWGRKKLGVTPLVVERLRDSGPLDLVVRAPRHLPVHSRAYTFRNDVLHVVLPRLDQKETLLGARKAPPPPREDGGSPIDSGRPDASPRPQSPEPDTDGAAPAAAGPKRDGAPRPTAPPLPKPPG